MKRTLLAVALLALAGLASADRRALLVGIDSYPIVKGRQLSGADYDLRLMSKMLEFYGFQLEQLRGPVATRQAIISKLATLAQSANSGDEIVFYFSGRGSIAPPADKPQALTQMEPTLVPFDGKATAIDYDLRMKRLEDWAQEVSAKGAHPTIIVDASFTSPTRDDFGRPYNPTPRMIRRPSTLAGEVRTDSYTGPGIYLSATASDGSAYEYLVNASNETWAGAFTDLLVNEVVSGLRGGNPATCSDALREVQAYCKDKVRQGYMPGLSPYPSAKALLAKAEVYDQPIFGGPPSGGIPPAKKPEIVKLDDDRKAREKKLRIGLSFPSVRGRSNGTISRDADDMEKERDPQLVAAMTHYVGAHMPFAEIEPPGAPIDLILSLAKLPSGGLDARVAGDEVDQQRNLRFSGKDVEAVMASGLAEHLERQGLTLRLFRLLDDESPTWDAKVRLESDKTDYGPKEDFELTFEADTPALLFVMDRDDADGIIQLTFPAPGATDQKLDGGAKKLGGQIEEGSPPGKLLVRSLFVDASAALPPIGRDALKGLLQQLRVLVPQMERKRVRWATKEISLTIRG